MTSVQTRRRRELTDLERAEIIALYRDLGPVYGAVAIVSRKVRRHPRVVRRVIDQAGLPRRRYRPKIDPELIEKIRQLDGRWAANELSLNAYIDELSRLRSQL
jgi:hypothetical protein